MRAILINSTFKTITEISIDKDDFLNEAYRHIGCSTIEAATDLPNGDTIFVDENGLLNDPTVFFEYAGAHQPFAGNGLIVSTDSEGDTQGALTSLKTIGENVSFSNVNEIRSRYGN
jgi:hypothetical protein